MNYDDNTPIVMLTVGQLKEILKDRVEIKGTDFAKPERKYVYGLKGIKTLFNVSHATASRIKQSGKIDKAIIQIGRKIIVDADLALELAGKPNGGRR